jgi:hypothetical protein
MGNRHSIGFAAAALLAAAGAGIQQGWCAVSWVLFGMGVLVLTLAFADRLPYLHKLPPPWGAVEPPKVECFVEGRNDLRFEMHDAPDSVLLGVGFSHRNRRKIRELDLNVYVVGSGRIQRCAQDRTPYQSGGGMQVADGPYWTESDIKLGRAQPMWFYVEIPEPGQYQIVVVMDSPEFYEPDGIELRRKSDVLTAVRRSSEEPAHGT